MDALELLQYSLGFAFEILDQVTADLTQEQADWTPPGTAKSIGSVYSHIITYVEGFMETVCIGQDLALLTRPQPEEWKLHDVQVGLPALHEHAKKIRAMALDWLSSLTLEDLEPKIVTFYDQELNVAQILEIYIIWHINAHCGEIAALKGCQGAKGYPW